MCISLLLLHVLLFYLIAPELRHDNLFVTILFDVFENMHT